MAILSIFTKFVLAFSCFVLTQANNISDDKNTLTFPWYDNVTAEKVAAEHNPDPSKHLAQLTNLYKEINGTVFLEGTNFTSQYPDSISWRKSTGFVDTVFFSYQKHHNLIIRPDDIWIAIIVQFSLYVNANAEALRHSFVNFEGKKKLEVEFTEPVDRVPINVFIAEIAALIDANIDPKVSSWIKPNFTTTTVNDELTAGAALMATMQKYFDYGLSSVLCGIPKVTITGDVNDWREIRKRVERLREFEVNGQNLMAKWSSMLGRILDEFINVKEGKEKDDEFWKQAIRIDYDIVNLHCALRNDTYLNGWITAFSAFDRSGRWQKDRKTTSLTNEDKKTQWLSIRTDKIASGVVHVPIQIYDEFAEPKKREYTGAIITGHMGYSVGKDEMTIQPISGWAMTVTNEAPDYLQNNANQNVNADRQINKHF